MILVEGHMMLLEEENLQDLCTLLLNQLTMIARKVPQKEKETGLDKQTREPKEPVDVYQDVLIIEHRCFFSELYT